MKSLLLSTLGLCVFLAGCDNGSSSGDGRGPLEKMFGAPTPTPVPTPVATPKPKSGSWMFEKDRHNPLDQPAKKK